MNVPLEQAQRELVKLLEQLKAGETLVITQAGMPLARVIREPSAGAFKDRVPGSAKGRIRYIAPDFDAPLEEFREYME